MGKSINSLSRTSNDIQNSMYFLIGLNETVKKIKGNMDGVSRISDHNKSE